MTRKPRRGVLLLIVLALLAMFSMVAVAFVIMTRTDRMSADRVRTIDAVVDSPDKTLQQAFNVVVRGSFVNPSTLQPTNSAITWQGLLEKIYGCETIGSLNSPAILSATTLICNGQLIEFTLPAAPPDPSTMTATTIDPFQYVGCVVTMLNGPAAGLSSRIVGINPQNYNVQMAAFEGGVQPLAGNQYIVNGFPYSGMGFGFSSTSGSMTNLALTPNAPPASWGVTKGAIIPGGVNGDYTAADYTDPLVALAVPNTTTGGVIVAIPSLHRSDLVQYSGGANRQVMFRPISSDHPSFTGSNPNFNPTWDGITPGGGQWDVDNDGDGVPDSVWVDLGLPVRFTTEGKAYKPLFAILCLDMDGRLNLNAHGSYAQTQSAYYSTTNVQPYTALSSPQGLPLDVGIGGGTQVGTVSSGAAYFAGPVGSSVATSPMALARGQGSGTAEVNLLPLFRIPGATSPSFYWNNYQWLLSGGNGFMGRYGLGIGSAVPGINGTGSPLTLNNNFPYNSDVNGSTYWANSNFQTIYDAYGSPPDPQTFGAVALDRAGRPLYISLGGPIANGPYDFDFTRNAAHAVDQATANNAFGVAEMESILRCYDRDAATLPQRLSNLTNSGSGSLLQSRRAEFTTESSWVPVSSGVLPLTLRTKLNAGTANAQRSMHPVDILAGAISRNGGSLANLNALRTQLLPWEILQGLKMDLNRPFGAGAFSLTPNYIGNLTAGGSPTIPDQPGTTAEHVPQITKPGGPPVAASFNYSADGTTATDSLAARQLYARHLYVLALALSDTGAILADLTKANASASPDDVTRLIAQWAVNVVAYRDHNGVMIPFPYDTNPLAGNAWSPDNTPLHTVWGCKRPELLITETLAFHDRRTQDLSNEVYDQAKLPADVAAYGITTYSRTASGLIGSVQASGSKDPSFNSQYRPQGSLFVELYNPWTVKEPRTADLGGIDPNSGVAGVQLNKMTPSVGGNVSPVWRLVIVVPSAIDPTQTLNAPPANGDELPDPDNPNVGSRPKIERVAYFVNLTGLTYPTTDGQVSYCPSVNAAGPVVVAPSGYAVVGSGDKTQTPPDRTYIGFENGQTTGQSSTRMLVMNQADPLLTDARVVRNTNDAAPPAGTPIPKVLSIDSAIVPSVSTANLVTPQRMSVSEPTIGYSYYEKDAKGVQASYNATTGQYNNGTTSLDIPVDQQREIQPALNPPANEGGIKIWTKYLNVDGTIPAYRIVYLQRLADPTRPFVADTAPGSTPQQWNPYRTVDAMTVDLTAFNGVTSATDPTTVASTFHFEAHQRGEKNYLPRDATSEMNLWKQEPANKSTLNPAGWTGGGGAPSATQYFAQPLSQTLGFLNKPFTSATPTTPAGDSQYPFPWLTYSGRPFFNEYELLLVPTVSSSRLLARNTPDPRRYFSYVDGAVRGATNASGYLPQNVYDPPGSAQISDQVPYPHLWNFFESGKSSQTGFAAQMHRILAYVGVPSRFANAQIQIRADLASAAGSHDFHTPFNRISRFRDPGRVNLNTVTSSDVLLGAMNLYPPLLSNAQLNPAFWDKFVRSRRGDGGGSVVASTATPTNATQQSLGNMLLINNKMPSRFMRPFRSPGGASLTLPAEPARETDVTLLRGDPDANLRPLFEVDDGLLYVMNGQTPPAVGSPDQFPLASIDYNRNPYFRYQMMQRLGNSFSTHSNVFAIWITVGYFEVMPASNATAKDANGNLIYPDGYQLGQELGSDSGDIVRHRAFYIFDRSIPCGFIRGQDINHDKATLQKRLIE